MGWWIINIELGAIQEALVNSWYSIYDSAEQEHHSRFLSRYLNLEPLKRKPECWRPWTAAADSLCHISTYTRYYTYVQRSATKCEINAIVTIALCSNWHIAAT